MRRRRELAPEDARAWWITLGAGLVVALVVAALLETLRRGVLDVERELNAVWTNGKRVAQNTQAAHVLAATRELGGELAAATRPPSSPGGSP